MKMLKMQINSNATKQMEALINKVDSFPNRIASIQQSALLRSQRTLIERLSRTHKGAKYIKFNITSSGDLGYKMTMTTPDEKNTSAYYAALVVLKGRRGGKVIKAKRGGLMALREESVSKGYPPYLKQANLGSIKSAEQEIKIKSKEIIIDNIRYAIQRFGFGPVGGAPRGLEDLPYIRSRAK